MRDLGRTFIKLLTSTLLGNWYWEWLAANDMTRGGVVIINIISNVCVCKIVVYKFLFLLPKSSYTWCLASFNYTCTIILKFKKSWLSPNVPYNHSKLTTFTSTSVIKIDNLIGTVIIHLCFVPLLIQLQL